MCDFHGQDICESRLKAQLEALASMFKDQSSLADIILQEQFLCSEGFSF